MNGPTLRHHLLVSDTIRAFNEDYATVIDEAGWVFDGAKGIAGGTYTDGPSDGH